MTIAASVNSSIRRVVAALLITASAVACGDNNAPPASVAPATTMTSTASTRTTLAAPTATPAAPVQRLRAEVVQRRPHDRESFTQGLVIAAGRLYEGTGIRGKSTLREVDARTGAVTRSVSIGAPYFGEGIAVVDDRIIQLTWQERTAFVYRLSDFRQVATFAYDTEGWGLCDDGARLVMSDGTSRLYLRNRSTFALLSTVSVTQDGVPIDRLNELECVDGQVYANVWLTDTIVRIDPASGRVTAEIDASGLLSGDDARGADVLNGIAYDPATKTFLLTGKLWPALFEVRFVAV
jgi:glutaminyl-peptide cyclotransferase